MRVIYKRTAVKDMEATRDYIAGRLKNPKAAKKLMTALHSGWGMGKTRFRWPQACSLLPRFPVNGSCKSAMWAARAA